MKLKLGIIILFPLLLLAEKCDYKYIDKNDKILNVSFDVKDKYGCEYDFRNIEKYTNGINLSFELEAKSNPNRLLKYFDKKKEIIFDILEYSAPETEKIRDVIFFNNTNILALLHGYYAFVDTPQSTVEVSSVFYQISLYKLYKNFFLKINIKDNSFEGIEGFYHGEYLRFKYKYHNAFIKKIRDTKITEKLILNSLEIFLKPNYAKKYDSKFTFKDSAFTLEALKAILKDIKINKKNLTTYNNIAYYLQKAGKNKEAVYLLEKILEKFPKRTVAYYNLGDAYWALGEKEKAKKAYLTYIKMMKEKGKEKRIPKKLKQRVKNKESFFTMLLAINPANRIDVEDFKNNPDDYNKFLLMDNKLCLRANMRLDHRIFGFLKPSYDSKLMILFSIFTDDVKNNPYKCSLGAYYDTTSFDIVYLKTVGDFIKTKIKHLNQENIVYFEKKWVKK